MITKQPKQRTALIEKFTLCEKILMRTVFLGNILIGAYSIYLENIFVGLLYSVFIILGLNFIVTYCICSHCPYPYKHSDCLFMPFKRIKKLHKFRGCSMSSIEKFGFIAMFAVIFLFPQYWLLKNYTLLILFWICLFPTIIMFPFYFCKRCKHLSCPFNLVKENKNVHQEHENDTTNV